MTVAQLITDIADVKNTATGLVEWDSNSLQVVIGDVEDLILERGVYQVADVTAMELVGNTETNFVAIEGVGMFFWSATGPYNGTTIFNAADGGFWRKQNISVAGATALIDLTDVNINTPTNGQGLIYDLATDKWINSTLVASWSGLSGKPRVVQEMTFGSVLPIYNIGLNDVLPSATSGAFGNIVLSTRQFLITDGFYSTIAAPRGLANVLEVENAVIITPRASLHTSSSGQRLVQDSIVLGDPGSLDDFYDGSGNLVDVIAIGESGLPHLIIDAGKWFFNYDASVLDTHDFIFNGTIYCNDDVRVDGDLDFNGIADFAGQVTIGGVLYTNSIFVPTWTDFTPGEVGTGWLRIFDTSGQLTRWRLDTMGRVHLNGGLNATASPPATICLSFADASIIPTALQVFTVPVTTASSNSYVGNAVITISPDGNIRAYGSVAFVSSNAIWLTGCSYFID